MDLAIQASGSDAELPVGAFDVKALRQRVLRYQPDILAFNGKSPAMAFLARRQVGYGLQSASVRRTLTFFCYLRLPAWQGDFGMKVGGENWPRSVKSSMHREDMPKDARAMRLFNFFA